ncbi:MAG TPA: cytochrome c oxidase subunit II [Candidatus Eisenbacteria bacterium]|nr:cytochrome c oxidase subunit II [Candidatus Eisenbacteria bacterium]
MQSSLPFFPVEASNFAGNVDTLFMFILMTTLFFAVLVTVLVIFAAFRYRRRSEHEVGDDVHGNNALEIGWTVIPTLLAIVIFAWGAVIYVNYRIAPPDTLDIYVIGKQWMWKLQQPNGRKEINELHIPVNRNVKLILGSEDVIHDFYVPAFRVKMDVVPGRYNTMWFRPTKVGKYHFFCSQYCGTNHAIMGGWVTVMDPAEYAAWLSGESGDVNPVSAGEKLFTQLACVTCHLGNGTGRAPSLNGVYGARVRLADGSLVTADDGYIRESILQPKAKIVAGYQPVMPTFQGLVTEEQIVNLTAYIKSLQSQPVPAKGSGIAPAEVGKK